MNPEIISGLDKVREVIHTHPLWYLEKNVAHLLDNYFTKAAEKQEHKEEWRKARREVVKVFADALESGQIFLGNAPESFNDDDRWCPMNWDTSRNVGISFLTKEVNQKVEKDHPDTVVIHHSSTAEVISIWEIEALSLLRLYVPNYRSKVFNDNGEYVPVSSGHYRDGRQTFIGYHYLVYPDGHVEQTLKDSYMGFHAGDLKVNQRGIGICLVGDFMETLPTKEAITAVIKLIDQYKPVTVIGHREVVHNGKLVDTKCPGDTWGEVKRGCL